MFSPDKLDKLFDIFYDFETPEKSECEWITYYEELGIKLSNHFPCRLSFYKAQEQSNGILIRYNETKNLLVPIEFAEKILILNGLP